MNEIQFLLYDLPDNEGNVQVVIKGGTLWMTQKAMAKLYSVNVPDISKHLKNIYDTGEQKVEATVSKMEIVQQEGKRMVNREQTWKNAPDGRVLKSDVSIAKNYLQQNEIRRLERAVTGFFDYIEDLIEGHISGNSHHDKLNT